MARVTYKDRGKQAYDREQRSDVLPAQGLVRGLLVLRVFKPGEGSLSHSQIAERTGLPSSTVSRLTHTLTALGYLWYIPKLGRYTLGTAVVSLCHSLLTGMPYRTYARPLLQQLADRFRLPVSLGARDQLSMVNLETVRHPSAPNARFDIGASLPIESTALGRACLYGMSASERDPIIAAILDSATSEKKKSIQDELDRAFESLETRGFCRSLGEWRPDVWGVGASVVTSEGIPLAINCGGHPNDLSLDYLDNEVGPRIASAALNLKEASLF